MSLPTQAAVMRAVKAALEPARKMGLTVSGYKVSFVQGVPCVDVTLGAESPLPAPCKGTAFPGFSMPSLSTANRNEPFKAIAPSVGCFRRVLKRVEWN